MTNSWAKMANCSIPLLLSLALVVPAMADTNLSQIQTSANQGDPSAQYSLGLKYYSGEGVSQSYNKAFEWYQKAAMQNYSDAQYNLGYMYENGKGTSKDLSKALNWYKKSALQGDADAQNQLGLIYSKSPYQDWDKAREWYQKAATQNHAMAQSNIGQMYYYGFGIPKNQVKAYDWFKKSAYQGNDKAQAKIDEMSQIGFVMNFIDSEFTKTSYHMINNVEYSPINDHYLVGQLSDSSSISESMSFSSGESYALAAICAMRCRNMTLTIYDRYGDIISEVIDADGTTAVQFEAAYTGDYTVDLNFDCQASSCLYKVQGYEASMSLDWLMYI